MTVRTTSPPTTAAVAPPPPSSGPPSPSPERLPALRARGVEAVAEVATHCDHPVLARVAAVLVRDWQPMGEAVAFYNDAPERFFR
ncbi:hypothetical protein ACFV3R_12955 [Streptomyces sp. NPDC059740]|uniref:hypothetical protein n=1 Tax=Streptomyces sp. NPDC059740 TaxID=3346926 RepID=UPI00365EAD5D